MDVQAALESGAVAIAVATGVYPRAELELLGVPPQVVVLDNLEQTDEVLQLMQLL